MANIFENFTQAVSDFASGTKDTFVDAAETVNEDFVQPVVDTAVDAFDTAVGLTGQGIDAISELSNDIHDYVGDTVDNVSDYVGETVDNIGDKASEYIDNVGTNVSELGGDLYDFGVDTIDEVTDLYGRTKDTISDFIEGESLISDTYDSISGGRPGFFDRVLTNPFSSKENFINSSLGSNIRRIEGSKNADIISKSLKDNTGYKGFIDNGGDKGISELEYGKILEEYKPLIKRNNISREVEEKEKSYIQKVYGTSQQDQREEVAKKLEGLSPTFHITNQNTARSFQRIKNNVNSDITSLEEEITGMARIIDKIDDRDIDGASRKSVSKDILESSKELSRRYIDTNVDLAIQKLDGKNIYDYVKQKIKDEGRYNKSLDNMTEEGIINVYTKGEDAYKMAGNLSANMSALDYIRLNKTLVLSQRGIQQLGQGGLKNRVLGLVNVASLGGGAFIAGLEQAANVVSRGGASKIESAFGNRVGDLSGIAIGNSRIVADSQSLDKIKSTNGNFNVINSGLSGIAQHAPDTAAFVVALLTNPFKAGETVKITSKGLEKTGMSKKISRLVSQGLNKAKAGSKFVLNEVREESLFTTLDPDAGSKFSEDLTIIGGLASAVMEFAYPLVKSIKRVTNGSSSRTVVLDALERAEKEALTLGVGDGVKNYNEEFINEMVDSYNSLKKKIGSEEYDKLNTVIGNKIKNAAGNKAIIDDAVKQGIIDSVVYDKAFIKGDETALAEVSRRISGTALSKEAAGIVEEIGRIQGNPFEILERVTGVPYTRYVSAVKPKDIGVPTYAITRDVANIFPEGKKITTTERYTAEDIISIKKKATKKGHKLKNTDDYFEKLNDGTYALKIDKLGEDVGLQKINYSTEDVARLNKDQESFINTLEKVNTQKGQRIFDTAGIVNSNLYNNTEKFLSNLLCK